MKNDRLRHGWTLDHLARESGINAAHLGRVESGKRPPTEKVAKGLDTAFTERHGWYLTYYEDLQKWAEVPAWFKPWSEHELATRTLKAWSPGTIDGLLQTPAYAEAQIALEPAITPERIAERVANRMARQRRVLHREDPPHAHFLVSVASLRNMPAHVRLAQLRRLLTASALPSVTVQLVPADVWHPGMSAGFIVADTAAYTEGVLAGQVYGDEESLTGFRVRFAAIQAEALPVSQSIAVIREMVHRERMAKVELLKRRGGRVPRSRLRRRDPGPRHD